MSHVGDTISAQNANWTFGGAVAESFDGHVSKSVPLYAEAHSLVCRISDFFMPNGSLVYDLGCSTGTLLHQLATQVKGKNVRFIGLDCEEAMILKAKQRCEELENVSIGLADILEYPFEQSNLITSIYTIQFVHPTNRQILFDRIYQALNWGGGFLFFEKVRAPDARFQDMMSLIYNDYKLDQGYSAEEIISKSRSLKGVLQPFSTQANIDMAHRAGFKDVMTVFKYACFEGFLAIR